MRRYIPLLIVFSLSLIFYLIVTTNNLAVSPDSVTYIKAAKNISTGNGYVVNNRPVTHWPPGYSLLLGAFSKISTIEVIDVGKFLNLVLLIILGLNYIQILKEMPFRQITKHFLLAIFLCSTPLTVSLNFWSELPFIVFLTTTLLFLLKWKNDHKSSNLIFAGIFSLLFVSTRYAGIGFVGGFLLIITFLNDKYIRKKSADIACYLFPIIVGLGCWVLYNNINSSSSTNRDFEIHIVSAHKILQSIFSIVLWFANTSLTKIASVIFLIITIYFTYKKFRKFQIFIKNNKLVILYITIPVASYYLFLLFSISFFDTLTPLDNRILSPLISFFIPLHWIPS